MSLSLTVLILLLIAAGGWLFAHQRAVALRGGGTALHSLPGYHATLAALWIALPALAVLSVLALVRGPMLDAAVLGSVPAAEIEGLSAPRRAFLMNDIQNLADELARLDGPARAALVDETAAWRIAAAERLSGQQALWNWGIAVVALALGVGAFAWMARRLGPQLRARNEVERWISGLLILCSVVAILTTFGIIFSLLFESWRFFLRVPVTEFLFGLKWSPQTALRADQVGSSGAFGAVPLFAGTLLITMIAMIVAVPTGLLAAVYLSEYASKRARAVAKPLLEILAGIPTVVYGFFAALTVAPFFRDVGAAIGLDVDANSALAAGVVMGVMIIPFVSSLSDDVINAVPQTLRDGSFALGATHSETITQVILPAALPGIVGAVLLAVSRAIGETMIVVMAAGLAANLTANPFEAVTTVTVQIATLLVGDQEFDSPKTLSVFALGLVLFIVTLALNVVALRIVQRFREKYD